MLIEVAGTILASLGGASLMVGHLLVFSETPGFIESFAKQMLNTNLP